LTAIEAGAITRYARLDRFEIVDQLPRTSVGKIDKKALRARFATEAPVDAATDELHKENLIEKDGTLHG
jgi:acyl-coenzyme A synthetase/AMP-(fatty) acid ligase